MRKRVSSIVKYATEDTEPAKISALSISSSDDFDNSAVTDQPISFDATIVWERMATGYRIGDLRSDRTSAALELLSVIKSLTLIKKKVISLLRIIEINKYIYVVSNKMLSLFQKEPTSTETLLTKDTTSLKSYRQLLTKIVKEGYSLCALREGTGKLVGVAVGSIVLKTNENDVINEDDLPVVMSTKKRIFAGTSVKNELDDVEKYFEICAICVDPEHRGKGIGTALLRSCLAKTKFLNLQICVGTFISDAIQRIGSRLGFEKLAEVPFASCSAESQDKSLGGIESGNYYLACMAMRIITEAETKVVAHNSPTLTNASKKSRKR